MINLKTDRLLTLFFDTKTEVINFLDEKLQIFFKFLGK